MLLFGARPELVFRAFSVQFFVEILDLRWAGWYQYRAYDRGSSPATASAPRSLGYRDRRPDLCMVGAHFGLRLVASIRVAHPTAAAARFPEDPGYVGRAGPAIGVSRPTSSGRMPSETRAP